MTKKILFLLGEEPGLFVFILGMIIGSICMFRCYNGNRDFFVVMGCIGGCIGWFVLGVATIAAIINKEL